MSFFRWMVGLPLAAAVTMALFLMMAGLIGRTEDPGTPAAATEINILPKIKPSPPRPRIDRPAPLEDPPLIDIRRTNPVGPVDPLPTPAPGRVTVDPVGPTVSAMRPIIRMTPQYPENCRGRGAEGVVIVQFDVTDRGDVANVEVISSSDRCFDRTVVKAVLGWKYPPQARRGVTEQFVFTLTE